MANVKISDLAPAILPIDAANTLFEVQTVEGGIPVSRKLAASDLSVTGTITIEDEGTPLATGADTLNFTGAGVTASGAGSTKTIDIPGAAGITMQTTYDNGEVVNINATPDPVTYNATVSGPIFEAYDTGANLIMQVLDTGVIAGNPGFEGAGILINGVTYDSVFKSSEIGSANIAQSILHRHSSTWPPIQVTARSQGDTAAHVIVNNTDLLYILLCTGWDGTQYVPAAEIQVTVDGPPGVADMPGQLDFRTTSQGAQVATSRLRIRQSGLVESDFAMDFAERAAALGTVPAGRGQLWVRNDAPNVLMFTDDTNTDYNLIGGLLPTGTGINASLIWDGSAWVENLNVFLNSSGPIFLKEIAAAVTDTPTYGQIWVGTDNNLYFTSETGTDEQLNAQVGTLSISGNTINSVGGNLDLNAPGSDVVNLQTGGVSRFQVDGGNSRHVINDFPIFIEERAAAGGDVAGFGQLFVRNDTPNVLVFRDDAGGETVLGAGGGGVNSVTGGSNITNSGTAADPILDVDDPLIISSINATSALQSDTTGSPYLNVPLNIGANLTGTQGMVQYTRQRIQARPSSFGFNSTLFINIEGSGTNGADTIIGGLNSAQLEVAFGVAVRMKHGTSAVDVCQTVDNGLQFPTDGTLFMDERAAAAADITNNGQFWVRNDTVQKPMFTDDAGRDHNLIAEFDEQTTDDTVNNTIVLAATQIQFADIPTGHYRIDGLYLLRDVAVSGCGARLQHSISGADPDSVMRVSNKNFSGAGAPSYDEIGLAGDLFDGIGLVTGSGTSRMYVTGLIEFISGTNSFEVEFSQNTAQVGDLDFEAGSWLSLTRIGP